MKSVYVKELRNYSKSQICEILGNNEKIFNKLQEYAIIDKDKDKYQCKYVGIFIIEESVIKCYPKYITNENNIEEDFKQVLNVVKKYKRLHDDLLYGNEELRHISFNLLSLMLFFIEDYYENGIYTNIRNMLEVNGTGEINWDKTINETYPLIRKNKPYYTELNTRYKINDLYDYFRLLHEYIITDCCKRLKKANLLDYFDLIPVELSDKTKDDFGDDEFILNKIEKELLVEYNTHKQKLLKSMHAYISEENSFNDENFLTLYGTTSYHVIWEEMCRQVFNDKFETKLKYLNLDLDFENKYSAEDKLKELIKNPKWTYKNNDPFHSKNPLNPDIITFFKDNFIILDAKYYSLKFEDNKVSNNPGISDISKQYLYQLAYDEFIKDGCFEGVQNAFLFPTYDSDIENEGQVELEMFSSLRLEPIQIIRLPAKDINNMYLNNEKLKENDMEMLFKFDSK